MDDFITYRLQQYHCRWIEIENDYYLIAGEDLEQGLLNENFEYVSDEAKLIDETILLYVLSEYLMEDEQVIGNYISKAFY